MHAWVCILYVEAIKHIQKIGDHFYSAIMSLSLLIQSLMLFIY